MMPKMQTKGDVIIKRKSKKVIKFSKRSDFNVGT